MAADAARAMQEARRLGVRATLDRVDWPAIRAVLLQPLLQAMMLGQTVDQLTHHVLYVHPQRRRRKLLPV